MVNSNLDAKAALGVMNSNSDLIQKLDEGFELLELAEDQQDGSIDFIFLEVNPAYEKLTGLKAGDIVGKHKKSVVPFAEKRWYDYAVEALKTGKTENYDYYNSYINRYLDTQFIPVSNNRIAVLFKDITERKIGETKLRESQERIRIYLESTPSAVFVADPEGNYQFVNESACRLLNYSRAELLSMNLREVIFEDDFENGMRQFALVKGTGSSKAELSLKRKEGSLVCVILSATKLPNGDLIANCEDITERRELEKQLQDKERLAAIGSTAGMVGHDIRNPLQAMVSDIYLLESYLSSEPDVKTKKDIFESLSGIEKNVAYVNKIVSDLQDYARPLNPEYSVVPMIDIINNSMKNIDVPNNISVQVQIEANMIVKTDPTFLQRAITNLANNAIQAMPKGGKLIIRGVANLHSISISVQDNGEGIPIEVQAKLFSPMTTTKAKGQGLGLAVVKRLIEALNGKINFESEMGKGTKFTISLPKHQD
jgi:PAS domain S-box-containing protein